jgi:1-aminocyclopropane-1-carboxylate deaminase
VLKLPNNTGACETLEAEVCVPSPMHRLNDDRLQAVGVEVWLKRDDLIHPDVPGNKWRKLRYNLMEAAARGDETLLTFGGAYSNNIRAVAAGGSLCRFSTVGIIRGEEHLPLNPSLAFALRQGMRLSYLSREGYRRKTEADVLDGLRDEFGSFYLLPEGGSNELAARGCAEIPAEIAMDFDVICSACGTGGTLAGIAAGLRPGQRAVGFSVLKGGAFLERSTADLQVRAFGSRRGDWRIETGFHFGGYARMPAELGYFVADFRDRHGVVLDWVYVAKMMYGIYALARTGAFEPGSRVVAVITGPPGPE